MTNGPVLFDLEKPDKTPAPRAAEAPPVPDLDMPEVEGRAMQAAGVLAARPRSRLVRWFWGLMAAVLGAVISIAAWDFVTGLLDRAPVLGLIVSVLVAALVLVTLGVALRELAGIGRLRRVDELRTQAEAALLSKDLDQARAAARRLASLYSGREDLRWGRERFDERLGDEFDAQAVLMLAEAEFLAPLDAAASLEVEAAARRVATVTALVPLAFADVAAALWSNLRMIRRIAEIYGGRSGFVGSWRLTRAVFTHLMATGAVAVGDDLLEPVLGGSLLSKLSRRFGEGLVNGALCARVGVAAIEVCRPLPFVHGSRPSVRQLVQRALKGLFSSSPGSS